MRKARKALVGVVGVLALAVAFAVPAGAAAQSAGASGSPIAVDAKKKCKKKKKKKCKKRGGGGGAYLEGRYSGFYSDLTADLFFNVLGGRLYSGPFDPFFARATCYNSSGVGSPTYTEVVRILPVQAFIGADGNFAGSGTQPTGSGRFIPWTISGHIQGGTISSGVLNVGPYPDFAGDPCSGARYFTASWFGAYTL
jgi:hypothetical protein